MVLLATDILIFLLLFVAVGFGLYARRKPHLAEPWRRVGRSTSGMSSLVVLTFFFAVGLLDSVHFRAADEGGAIISLFDELVTPMREADEKTYSAPLSAHLYVKEPVLQPDGTSLRVYPRLVHGGAHLADPDRRWADIGAKTLQAVVAASVLWLLLVLLFCALRRGGFAANWQRLWRNGYAVPWRAVFITLLAVLIVTCWLGYLSLYYHVLGTDKVGEDVLYQSLKSIRTGLVIGTLTTLVMLPLAVVLGIMAGYFKGWADDVIQFIYTTLNAIPGVLLIAAAVLMMHVYMANNPEEFASVTERADFRLLFLCLILGVTSWTGLCRLLRGETFRVREMDYIEAAQAFGVTHGNILMRHVFPNVLHIVLITVVLDFSNLVLAEAVLSYIEIGVDPTTHSWGNMINSARLELAREPVVWWSLAAAFIFMFALVLFANLFADTVRDAFDPRIRQRTGSAIG